MKIPDLSRWHWVGIALAVGLALSCAWSGKQASETLPTISQREFESGLLVPYPQHGHLAHLTILPAVMDKYTVVAEQFRSVRPGVIHRYRVAFVAEAPYWVGDWQGSAEQYRDVRHYLAAIRRDHPNVPLHYRYAWWRETWAVFLLWTATSLVLIGVVWPSLISLASGGGLGFKRWQLDSQYDLDRFRNEAAKQEGSLGASADDAQHLRQLNEELEKHLESDSKEITTSADQSSKQPLAPPEHRLDGEVLDAVAPPPAEEHEYSGDFYPVERRPNRKSF